MSQEVRWPCLLSFSPHALFICDDTRFYLRVSLVALKNILKEHLFDVHNHGSLVSSKNVTEMYIWHTSEHSNHQKQSLNFLTLFLRYLIFGDTYLCNVASVLKILLDKVDKMMMVKKLPKSEMIVQYLNYYR